MEITKAYDVGSGNRRSLGGFHKKHYCDGCERELQNYEGADIGWIFRESESFCGECADTHCDIQEIDKAHQRDSLTMGELKSKLSRMAAKLRGLQCRYDELFSMMAQADTQYDNAYGARHATTADRDLAAQAIIRSGAQAPMRRK